MLDLWRAADEAGVFESGWTSDHIGAMHEADPGTPRLDGWMTLAALAQATRRLRLGVLVSGAHYRHPVLLARMAATVDAISGGRLELGIGAGWNGEEALAYGMELGTPRQRSDRLEEACRLIASQPSHPPICVGGSGEKRTLRTAARYAQHWNFDVGRPGQFARARDVLRQHCADIGRDPAQILMSAQVRFTGDAARTADEAAAFAELGCRLVIIYLPLPYATDAVEPLAGALAEMAGDEDRGP